MDISDGKIGISLLFAEGARPSESDLEPLLTASLQSKQPVRISHRASGDGGRLELLVDGLTYDLRGLAPGPAQPLPPADHVYGLPADIDRFGLEAISLAPGQHIAAGRAQLPIVRIQLALAANITLELPVTALAWNPANVWMDPKYFGRLVLSWFSGGNFPALGLTGLRWQGDGALESSGLAYFTGQEVRLSAREGEPASDTTKLAGQLIDYLVRTGPVETADRVPAPSGEMLVLEPSVDRRLVTVSRLI